MSKPRKVKKGKKLSPKERVIARLERLLKKIHDFENERRAFEESMRRQKKGGQR